MTQIVKYVGKDDISRMYSWRNERIFCMHIARERYALIGIYENLQATVAISIQL